VAGARSRAHRRSYPKEWSCQACRMSLEVVSLWSTELGLRKQILGYRLCFLKNSTR
jgi:hypothetical protein